MTSEGAIFDLDYRRYQGERIGRAKIRWVMVRDGVRKVLGLRRRARRKILPWGLIILVVLPAIAIVGFRVFTEGLGADELLADLIPDHADYFDNFTFVPTFLFIALSAPELLIPDRVSNVLTVYASRPLTRVDYLIARVGALMIVVLAFTLLPQLILYLGGAVLSGDVVGHVTGNLDLLWKIPGAALIVFATQAGVAFIISAFARRRGMAAGIYIGFTLMSTLVAHGLAQAVSRWFALIDLQAHALVLIGKIFSQPEIGRGSVLIEHNISPWVSLLVVFAIAALAGSLLDRRYRRLM